MRDVPEMYIMILCVIEWLLFEHSEQNIAEGKIVLMCVMFVVHQFDVCDAAWTI